MGQSITELTAAGLLTLGGPMVGAPGDDLDLLCLLSLYLGYACMLGWACERRERFAKEGKRAYRKGGACRNSSFGGLPCSACVVRDKWTCSAVSIAPLVSVTDLGTRCETAFGQLPRATALEVSTCWCTGSRASGRRGWARGMRTARGRCTSSDLLKNCKSQM